MEEKMKKGRANRKKGSKSGKRYNEQRRRAINLLFFGILCLCVLVLLFAAAIKQKGNGSSASHTAFDQSKSETAIATEGQKYQAVEDIYLDKDTGIAGMNIVNEVSGSVYLKVTVELENGETLYESELLKPGSVLKEIRIERELSEGEYEFTISIDSYALADEQLLNGVVYTRKLYVK